MNIETDYTLVRDVGDTDEELIPMVGMEDYESGCGMATACRAKGAKPGGDSQGVETV